MSAPAVKQRLYEALEGFRYIADERLIEVRQLRFPRSKRRRIRRKWARRPGNVETRPSPNVIFCGEDKTVVAHPATLFALKARVAESRRAHASELAAAGNPEIRV